MMQKVLLFQNTPVFHHWSKSGLFDVWDVTCQRRVDYDDLLLRIQSVQRTRRCDVSANLSLRPITVTFSVSIEGPSTP
jgi:hypothetical protein